MIMVADVASLGTTERSGEGGFAQRIGRSPERGAPIHAGQLLDIPRRLARGLRPANAVKKTRTASGARAARAGALEKWLTRPPQSSTVPGANP